MGHGVVFKLTPNSNGSWTEKVLVVMSGDFSFPQAGLTINADGNLYGTALGHGYGSVFELKKNPDGSWGFSVLREFGNGVGGGYPAAGVILDAAGNVYGTTEYDGPSRHSDGVVFNLTRKADGTWKENVLYGFSALRLAWFSIQRATSMARPTKVELGNAPVGMVQVVAWFSS